MGDAALNSVWTVQKLKKRKRNKATSNGRKARSPRERRVGEKKRRVVGGEQGSNGISVLVSNGNELAIQLHVEPTS